MLKNVWVHLFSARVLLFSIESMEKTSKLFNVDNIIEGRGSALANYARLADTRAQTRAPMLEVIKDNGAAQFSQENFAFKNRDRATIIADILGSLVGNPRGKRKTNIKQSANLSTCLLNKYLELLLHNDFVIEDGGIYKPTTKGLKLLQNLDIQYLKMTVGT
jgi:predicted transcriptional regulator